MDAHAQANSLTQSLAIATSVYKECICRNPSLGLATKAKGLEGCEPRESPRVKAKGKKPGNQGKGIARVQAKKKPGSHITYSRECKKV